jgi:hypothetical protein
MEIRNEAAADSEAVCRQVAGPSLSRKRARRFTHLGETPSDTTSEVSKYPQISGKIRGLVSSIECPPMCIV